MTLKYDPPAGKVGAAVARLLGQSPERQIESDLAKFKSIVEGTPPGVPNRSGS